MWTLSEKKYCKDDITLNGNRFLLGNGNMGYRGTMEEYGPDQQVGIVLNGLYNQVGDKWREPVNSPDYFYTTLHSAGAALTVLEHDVLEHEQSLDLRNAVHTRRSVFEHKGVRVVITAERFLSQSNVNLACMEYTVEVDGEIDLQLRTGINKEIWDINGPHLLDFNHTIDGENIHLQALTSQNKVKVCVAEKSIFSAGSSAAVETDKKLLHEYCFTAKPGESYVLLKYAAVCNEQDVSDAQDEAVRIVEESAAKGYDGLLQEHANVCETFWKNSDIVIEGDDEAQFALRYSLYHMMILAIRHSEQVSIPARGLSGQVYKGAVFWDTEMFMLPFFSLTDPAVARNLIMYRYHTLKGAREKAAEYGFEGAYFAWESQDQGYDACTHFNVTDVFSGRPMRTYFRDKQIHVSADIPFAINRYIEYTSDMSILADGALEVLVECSRFFYSYAYYKMSEERFELLDVTGPDEYHERINNNAYTNRMVKEALLTTLTALEYVKEKEPQAYSELDTRLVFSGEIDQWRKMFEELYVPQPDAQTQLIEQFDRYFKREDPTVAELKSRMLDPNEYLGGGNGLAEDTQVLKQADVLLMLNLFREEYPAEVVQKNWEYYEPRTEHGSSLSACAYSMTAASTGKIAKAYEYFMKTATIDLNGKSKQFVGTLYIGGTHPAANGGSWMCVAFGFAGIRFGEEYVRIAPALPDHWQKLSLPLQVGGDRFEITMDKDKVLVQSCTGNNSAKVFKCFGSEQEVSAGATVEFSAFTQTDYSGVIFDLDGVLLSTDDYHYKAWKLLADRENIYFDKEINERLRGVSRMESLDIILEKAEREYSQQEKEEMCEYKNNIYRSSLNELTPDDVFCGVVPMLEKLRDNGIRVAVGSSSKNAGFILEKTKLDRFFTGAVSDGNCIQNSKPHPEVFLKAAEFIKLEPAKCLVIEDADAGVEAAKAAGMKVAGVGSASRTVNPIRKFSSRLRNLLSLNLRNVW